MLLNRGIWSLPSRTVLLITTCICLFIVFGTHVYTRGLPATVPWKAPPSTAPVKRALVLPTIDIDSVEWFRSGLLEEFNYQTFIYCMGSNTTKPECHLPRTKNGNEAGAYISFVLDYYDDLPDYAVFMHDSREQWHNDVLGPNQDLMLPHIRWQGVDASGFLNLRCLHEPGCPSDITPFDTDEFDIEHNTTRARFVGIYQELFGVTVEEVPKAIANVCCAQFAVSKQQILKRPKSDYERLLKWLVEAESDSSHSKGWAFEKIWHIIFSMPPVHCPAEDQCRCDVYGWCGPLVNGKKLKALGDR